MSAGLILDVQSEAPEVTGAELRVAPWCGNDRPPRGAAYSQRITGHDGAISGPDRPGSKSASSSYWRDNHLILTT